MWTIKFNVESKVECDIVGVEFVGFHSLVKN